MLPMRLVHDMRVILKMISDMDGVLKHSLVKNRMKENGRMIKYKVVGGILMLMDHFTKVCLMIAIGSKVGFQPQMS